MELVWASCCASGDVKRVAHRVNNGACIIASRRYLGAIALTSNSPTGNKYFMSDNSRQVFRIMEKNFANIELIHELQSLFRSSH